jgi:2-oxo-4-hydroxy-4-carboxy-5-ureidoimidazoline decarboxylase
MAEPHQVLNALSAADAAVALARCCASSRWVDRMLALRPYPSTERLYRAADAQWSDLSRDDYLEAFAHHPAIGADLAKLREKFAATASWSGEEQAGVHAADEATLLALRDGNARYRERFGHVFLVCATGKSAAEMLQLLQARIDNTPDDELALAAAEQAKITRIRLGKLGGA